jgi:uncharacterized protein
MFTDDSPPSPDGRSGSPTRRRVLQMAATVAAFAPLAAVGASAAAQASPPTRAAAPRRIGTAILVPRFGGDASADWYSAAETRLADLGIRTKVVPLLPHPTTPGIDATVAAIARAAEDDPHEIARTILVGHSVGSRALLAYLGRHGAHRTFAGLVSVAGWFTIYDVIAYPALESWMSMDLDFPSIAAAAGPITVLLSDNDPYTADWRANAASWLGKLGAAVHIAHGAGHYVTRSPDPVLDTIRVASLR